MSSLGSEKGETKGQKGKAVPADGDDAPVLSGERVSDRVKYGTWRRTPVAAKNAASTELRLLVNLRHPNVIQYLAHTPTHVLTARCAGGTLAAFAKAHDGADDALQAFMGDLCGGKGDPEMEGQKTGDYHQQLGRAARAFAWAVQVASAVHYLHARGIVHGCVRPENVFVDGSGMQCRLGGLSRCEVGQSKDARLSPRRVETNKDADEPGDSASADKDSPRHGGEPPAEEEEAWRWQAPEQVPEEGYTSAGDVWSLGVLVWDLASGCASPPYPEGKDARKDPPAPRPAALDASWDKSAAACFTPALQRPTAAGALQNFAHASDWLVAAGVEFCQMEEADAQYGSTGASGTYMLLPTRHNSRPAWRHAGGARYLWWSQKERMWINSDGLGEAEGAPKNRKMWFEGHSLSWPWMEPWGNGAFLVVRVPREKLGDKSAAWK